MKPHTVFLQALCAVLGAAAVISAFALTERVLWGGLIVGSIMFMAAGMLGAESSSSNPRRRNAFKGLAVASALPLVVMLVYEVAKQVVSREWTQALSGVLKTSLLVALLASYLLESRPFVQRVLKKFGVQSTAQRE